MNVMKHIHRPSLTFLSDKALDEIHHTSLRILSEIGMRLHSQYILELLAEQKGMNLDMGRQLAAAHH